MDSPQSKNYTPLPASLINPPTIGHTNRGKFIAINVLSFFVAFSVVSLAYVTKMNSQQQSINSFAADPAHKCLKGIVENPAIVKGTSVIDNKIIDIKAGDKVTSSQVTLEWDKVPGVEMYYVTLNQDPGTDLLPKTDPILDGKVTKENKFTFTSLRPNTTYYLYVRSKGFNKSLGLTVPTPGMCDYVVPAKPIFSFTAAP
jgi:hypothetical protein